MFVNEQPFFVVPVAKEVPLFSSDQGDLSRSTIPSAAKYPRCEF